MCLQLFVDHVLIFASNCNLSNASVHVNESIDMMHVYDMYTTVAPFLSNMSNASALPSISNDTLVAAFTDAPSPSEYSTSAPSPSEYTTNVPSPSEYTTSAPVSTITVETPSVSSVVSVQETTSMPNDLANHTDGMPDFIPYIDNITIYMAIVLPVVVLVLIWCITALIRKYCTPCKPKKPPIKKKTSCCAPKPSRPATPKVKDSSCCCRKVAVEPETKTPEERMISQA